MVPSCQTLILRYFEAIDFNLSEAAITLEVVESIMLKHGRAFAATTLPANLNDDVRLDFPNLAEYLLSNRYGYCFHHNIVAFEALKYLGFNVELLAASMRIDPENPDNMQVLPLATHVCILLTLQSKKYLLDPGWGSASLKPLPLDEEKVTPNTAYRVCKVSEDRYALVEVMAEKQNKEKMRYQFSSAPVRIDDFEQAIKYVMSNLHDFYKMFFYIQKLPSGDIHYIVGRKYTCTDSKGNKKSESFDQPAKQILQSKFKLNQAQIARLTQSSYPNPAVKKTIVEFNLPKKVYQNIYVFFSTDLKKCARQISKSWKENCDDFVASHNCKLS